MAKTFGQSLAKKLHEAGLIPDDLNDVRRAVLVMEAGSVPVLYVEYLIDDSWLEVVKGQEGIRIQTRSDHG